MKSSGRHCKLIPIILISLLLIVCALLVDSNLRLVTSEYGLFYSNLPAEFDGFRITVLSDIHAAEFGRNNKRLIKKVWGTAPDIIAITGDLIDGDKSPTTYEQLAIAGRLASELIEIAPVYYITGNHDWNSGAARQLITILEECGVAVLRNSYTLLEEGGVSIVLAGTDDPNGPADIVKPRAFVESIMAAEGSRFKILLEHRNNHLQLYSELGVDLILSGHAHGGIVRLPFTDGLIGPSRDFLPTYTSGVYPMGTSNMVVSRGVGNHTGWPRFLNNPQVVVVELFSDN